MTLVICDTYQILVICEADLTATIVYNHQCKYMIPASLFSMFFSECQSFIIMPVIDVLRYTCYNVMPIMLTLHVPFTSMLHLRSFRTIIRNFYFPKLPAVPLMASLT